MSEWTLKEKSVLIEGDDIYGQVIGSYTSAWKEGNHLDIFWKEVEHCHLLKK